MRTSWGDEEDAALQGLSADAQVIYLRAMRRYMNYDSGVVEVSFGTMKRVLEFIPDQASTSKARRVADISDNYIRARCSELERAGLSEAMPKRSRFDRPRFFLAKAQTGTVRPKEEPQKNHKDGTTDNEADRSEAARGVQMESTEHEQQENHKDGTTREPVSGIYHTVPYRARVDFGVPDSFVPEKQHEWAQFMVDERGFAFHLVQSVPVVQMFVGWVADGVSVGDVRMAMLAAEAKLERVPDGPAFYRNFVKQVLQKKQRGEEVGHAAGGGSGARGRKLSPGERAAEQERSLG